MFMEKLTQQLQKKIFRADGRRGRHFAKYIVMACLFTTLPLLAAQPETPAADRTPPLDSSTNEYVIIKPSDQATFSSETAASVATISVEEGSRFDKNDILLQLDCRLQRADLNKALAQQYAAKIAQQSATKLKNYGSISEFEVVKATSEAQIANAEVDRLSTIVEKCTIKAPFSGSVAEIMVHAHESVKPGDPLLRIVNTDNLEFEIQVPSCWLQSLHIDSIFNVHINEINKTIPAKITKINPQIEPVSQSVKLIATITPNNSELLPGMSGQAIFPGDPEQKCNHGKT